MSNKLKKKKIKNKIKKNKKRRTVRAKTANHLNLGQHQQNLPQYTRTVYVNVPSQQLNPVGPDQSELINQVIHNNNFIKKNNLLLQNDLNSQVQEEKKTEHPLDHAKLLYDKRGGTVHSNLSNTVVRIPNEKIKKTKHKVQYLDEDDGYDGGNDLNNMVHHKKQVEIKDNDLNAVITRPDDVIHEANDERNLEPVIVPDIIDAVLDVKKVTPTKKFFDLTDAKVKKERLAKEAKAKKAKELKEDKEIENELHQQALKAELQDDIKSRSTRHKKRADV
jgi:hypothetical protein